MDKAQTGLRLETTWCQHGCDSWETGRAHQAVRFCSRDHRQKQMNNRKINRKMKNEKIEKCKIKKRKREKSGKRKDLGQASQSVDTKHHSFRSPCSHATFGFVTVACVPSPQRLDCPLARTSSKTCSYQDRLHVQALCSCHCTPQKPGSKNWR